MQTLFVVKQFCFQVLVLLTQEEDESTEEDNEGGEDLVEPERSHGVVGADPGGLRVGGFSKRQNSTSIGATCRVQ